MKKAVIVFWVLVLGIALPPVLQAEIVTEVGVDGTMTLADGKRVVLAGVKMDSEGASVLRVLAQRQDLKFQLLAQPAPDGKEYAYAYLKAKYVKFPAAMHDVPSEKEVLLNEFLLKIGAARVDEGQDFSQKVKFLKVQEEAQKKGEGVWSYAAS